MSIESPTFPMIPSQTPDVIKAGINVGEVLIPLPLAKFIAGVTLAWIGWRLFKGFRNNQKGKA